MSRYDVHRPHDSLFSSGFSLIRPQPSPFCAPTCRSPSAPGCGGRRWHCETTRLSTTNCATERGVAVAVQGGDEGGEGDRLAAADGAGEQQQVLVGDAEGEARESFLVGVGGERVGGLQVLAEGQAGEAEKLACGSGRASARGLPAGPRGCRPRAGPRPDRTARRSRGCSRRSACSARRASQGVPVLLVGGDQENIACGTRHGAHHTRHGREHSVGGGSLPAAPVSPGTTWDYPGAACAEAPRPASCSRSRKEDRSG